MSKEIAEGEGAVQSNPYLTRVKFVEGWVSQQEIEAIVTLYPQNLEPTDEINAELLEHAGPALDKHILENVLEPKPADVAMVPGFDLPAQNIIIGIVPVWRTEFDRVDKSLLDACRAAIGLAKGENIRRLAFPLLVGGKFGYPKKRAVRLLSQVILEELDDQIDEIRIVCPDDADLQLFKDRLS